MKEPDFNEIEERTMIANTGRRIPLPPTDPEERRRWKTTYFADLYGTSPEKVKEIVMRGINQTESRIIRHTAKPFPWRTYTIAFVLLIGVLVYLFVRSKP